MKTKTCRKVNFLILCLLSSSTPLSINKPPSTKALPVRIALESDLPIVTSSSLTTPNNARLSHILDGRVCLRIATRADVPSILQCNLETSSENYPARHYDNYLRRWPDLALVAEYFPSSSCDGDESVKDEKKIERRNRLGMHGSMDEEEGGKIVGYILGKIVKGYHTSPRIVSLDESKGSAKNLPASFSKHRGHIASIAILPAYRRCGLAMLLMKQVHQHISSGYIANYVGLNVSVTNIAARRLYCEKLGYEATDMLKRYYDDDSDAYFMRKSLSEAIYDNDDAEEYTKDSRDPPVLGLIKGAASFWDEKIGRAVRSHWGKKDDVKSPVWENGPKQFRLPRDIPLKL